MNPTEAALDAILSFAAVLLCALLVLGLVGCGAHAEPAVEPAVQQPVPRCETYATSDQCRRVMT